MSHSTKQFILGGITEGAAFGCLLTAMHFKEVEGLKSPEFIGFIIGAGIIALIGLTIIGAAAVLKDTEGDNDEGCFCFGKDYSN